MTDASLVHPGQHAELWQSGGAPLIYVNTSGDAALTTEQARGLMLELAELLARAERVTQPPTRESHCSCGRPAVEVLDGGAFGPTGYCGGPGLPSDPCDCGQGADLHDRTVCDLYGRGMPRP